MSTIFISKSGKEFLFVQPDEGECFCGECIFNSMADDELCGESPDCTEDRDKPGYYILKPNETN